MAQIENLRLLVDLIALTAVQVFDGIRGYASEGGVGPRLYDKLIGEVAVVHGIGAIITWNIAHMRGLFPSLNVVDPIEFSHTAFRP